MPYSKRYLFIVSLNLFPENAKNGEAETLYKQRNAKERFAVEKALSFAG